MKIWTRTLASLDIVQKNLLAANLNHDACKSINLKIYIRNTYACESINLKIYIRTIFVNSIVQNLYHDASGFINWKIMNSILLM